MKLKFNAWLRPENPAAFESFKTNARWLTRVYPAWYTLGHGGFPRRPSEAGLLQRQAVLALARDKGVEVWPLIESLDGALMRLVMGDRGTRKGHILRLIQWTQEDGGAGVILNHQAVLGPDRELFANFVDALTTEFHAAGLRVGLALAPGEAFNLRRLGARVDRLQLRGAETAALLDSALKLVPREKLELGVPGAGKIWDQSEPQPLNWQRWCDLVQKHGPERRDPNTAELALDFEGHRVWMNDAHTLAARLWQARERGVGEVALEGLGSEDPRVWALIETLPEDFVR